MKSIITSLTTRGIAIAVLAIFLPGCAEWSEQMRQEQIRRDEVECNPGSYCFSQLSPGQQSQLMRDKRDAAYQDEMIRLQREQVDILRRAQQDERRRHAHQEEMRRREHQREHEELDHRERQRPPSQQDDARRHAEQERAEQQRRAQAEEARRRTEQETRERADRPPRKRPRKDSDRDDGDDGDDGDDQSSQPRPGMRERREER